MKFLSNSNSLLLAAAFVSLQACSDICEVQNPQNGDLLKSLSATVTDFELGEDEATRTSYVVSPTEGFVFSWALGDTLGIYPVGGNQVDFPISDGIGTKTALFDGGSWALRSSYTYAGYYPYSANHYHNPQTAIPVTFAGQKQSGNNKLDGLSKYDYMAAAPVGASLSGSVNLELKHLASFVRFQLTMPSVGNYTSLTLTSGDVKFIETATYDLTSETPSLTPVTSSETFTLALEDISTTEANQVITLYAMIAPVSQKTSSITIRVADDKKNTYSIETTGKNLTAGKSYNYSLVLEGDGTTGGSGEDAGWDSDDDPFNGLETLNGHKYVDLGLPSGLKWAACNVGANSPEDFGDYFAWGETEPYYTAGHSQDSICSNWKPGKTGYDWNSYDSCNGGTYILAKLKLVDDAANANWGGSWRMPTQEDFIELLTNCTILIYSQNSVSGYKIEAPNGNWIFLPFAGSRYDAKFSGGGKYGSYWTSTPCRSNPQHAYFLSDNGTEPSVGYYYRCWGRSVRPVTE